MTKFANYSGTVKWYNAEKGYGFITGDDGRDLFVEFSNIREDISDKNLHEGDTVIFDIEEAERGLSAVNVMKR